MEQKVSFQRNVLKNRSNFQFSTAPLVIATDEKNVFNFQEDLI